MYSYIFCDKIFSGDFMRLRNVKNKEEILSSSTHLIRDPFHYCGRWHELFQNDHPIYIEIGMGKGKFMIDNALMYPDINFIGIEKYDSVLAKAVQKLPYDIPNLYFIRGDALEIDQMFLNEIQLIYLNFSDPWPKNRHSMRRLSSSLFLDKYDKIFYQDKTIEMRTDNASLYAYSIVSFSTYGYTLLEASLDFHQDYMPLVTTEYEDKFSSNDCPIYYVKCHKD